MVARNTEIIRSFGVFTAMLRKEDVTSMRKNYECPMASTNLILWQRNLLCSSMRGSEKLPKVLISERQMP